MITSGTLIERFVARELDDSVRSVLKMPLMSEFAQRAFCSGSWSLIALTFLWTFKKASSHCKTFFPLERVAFLIYRCVILSLFAI